MSEKSNKNLAALKPLWVLMWLPGYVLVYFFYYFPTEWGSKRNVDITHRQMKGQHFFAPIYAILLYIGFLIFLG